jgi:hypothetical protein
MVALKMRGNGAGGIPPGVLKFNEIPPQPLKSPGTPGPFIASPIGKSGPSANGVLAILATDDVQLEVKFPKKRHLLVEKVILPDPGGQVAHPHPHEAKRDRFPPVLAKQRTYFLEEDLIDIRGAGQGAGAGVSNKICMSDLDRHRASLNRRLAQLPAYIFGKGDKRGLKQPQIRYVFLKGVLPRDRFDLLSRKNRAYVFSLGPSGKCLSPFSKGESQGADRYPGEIPHRDNAPVAKLPKKSRTHPGQALDAKRSKKLRLHSIRNHGEAGRLPVVRGHLGYQLVRSKSHRNAQTKLLPHPLLDEPRRHLRRSKQAFGAGKIHVGLIQAHLLD